jgi:hypothetical protein
MSLEDEYIEGARKFYPLLSFGMKGGFSINDVSQGEQFDFYNHQQILTNTEYFDGKPKKFSLFRNVSLNSNERKPKDIAAYKA